MSVPWRMLRLVLKLVQETSTTYHVIRVLQESCRKIKILNNCFSATTSFSAELKESCIDAGVLFLQFLSFMIKLMRHDVIYTTKGSSPPQVDKLTNSWLG